MNINFKEWQTELLRNCNCSDQTLFQYIRKILKKFKAEIDQQNFQKMFEFIYNSSSDDIPHKHSIAPFIASLILQLDMSVLKSVCITTDNCIPMWRFGHCSFDEFSNQKLGFDVSEVKLYAFGFCKADKISINGKNNLTMHNHCICISSSNNSNFVAHISAGNNLQINANAFRWQDFYELKLKAANIINMEINCISNATIDTLIIDTPVLRIGGLGNYFDLKQQRRKWGFSIKRLVISKEIIDQWGEEKILKLFKPNILEIL